MQSPHIHLPVCVLLAGAPSPCGAGGPASARHRNAAARSGRRPQARLLLMPTLLLLLVLRSCTGWKACCRGEQEALLPARAPSIEVEGARVRHSLLASVCEFGVEFGVDPDVRP